MLFQARPKRSYPDQIPKDICSHDQHCQPHRDSISHRKLGQVQSAQSKELPSPRHRLSSMTASTATQPWQHQHYFHEIQAATLLTKLCTSHLAKSFNGEYPQMHVSQYSTLMYCTVPCSAVQCSAAQCISVQHSKLQHAGS